jgi:long-chain acyl-CoA synthetase
MHRNGDQHAFLLLSAGTTGPPKIVPRTAAQIEAALGIFRATLPYSEEDRILAVLPFFHSFGLLNVLLSSLAAGATLCVSAFSPRETAAAIERERVTALPATPFMFRLLTEAAFRRLPDFASLRLAVSVGSALSPAVALGFQEKFGVAVAQSYGTTETGPVALARPEERLDGAGWVGRPYVGVTVQIYGLDGRALGLGAQGLVGVTSAANAASYLGDAQAGAPVFRGGCVLTGDVGRLNDAGHLFVLGRARPMLNVAGKKVSPAEVEACLRTHPRVADVLVVGANAAGTDQRVKAFVVPAGPLSALELVEFCGKRLAEFKVPRQIVFVADLSRGPMGKPPPSAPEHAEE